jgi:hypothetical protein
MGIIPPSKKLIVSEVFGHIGDQLESTEDTEAFVLIGGCEPFLITTLLQNGFGGLAVFQASLQVFETGNIFLGLGGDSLKFGGFLNALECVSGLRQLPG